MFKQLFPVLNFPFISIQLVPHFDFLLSGFPGFAQSAGSMFVRILGLILPQIQKLLNNGANFKYKTDLG